MKLGGGAAYKVGVVCGWRGIGECGWAGERGENFDVMSTAGRVG